MYIEETVSIYLFLFLSISLLSIMCKFTQNYTQLAKWKLRIQKNRLQLIKTIYRVCNYIRRHKFTLCRWINVAILYNRHSLLLEKLILPTMFTLYYLAVVSWWFNFATIAYFFMITRNNYNEKTHYLFSK